MIARQSSPGPARRRLKILAVGSGHAGRDALLEHLAGWGCIGQAAEDAGAALEMLDAAVERRKPFGLAVVDMDLPAMNGLELGRAIQDSPELRGLPLILLAAGDGPGPDELRACGFVACLPKPPDPSRLLEAIAAAVPHAGSAGDGEAARLAAAAASRELTAMRQAATILIAEDNDINQIVVQEVLRRSGYGCRLADDGLQAVAAVQETACDAVLMDCQMPHMDGLEACRQIRLLEREGRVTSRSGGRLPIIALTASAVPGDREACMAAGMDDYLTKPIDGQSLLAMLDGILRRPAQSPVLLPARPIG